MDIAIVSYQRFTDMPRDVYNACCQMGHTEASPWYRGHLRKLARRTRSNNTGRLDYRLRNALVMYAGDLIVGWAALYYVDGDTNPTASVCGSNMPIETRAMEPRLSKKLISDGASTIQLCSVRWKHCGVGYSSNKS